MRLVPMNGFALKGLRLYPRLVASALPVPVPLQVGIPGNGPVRLLWPVTDLLAAPMCAMCMATHVYARMACDHWLGCVNIKKNYSKEL